MGSAMSRFTEKPMARAAEHLASARYAEAAGAFRAVLRIDPTEFQAHFGLADALVARGQRSEAVEGLVGAAEACSGQDDHAAALTLYGKALSIEPGRLELHLDVAMAEAALGRMEAAQSRLENLAEVYMQAGRTDEAAEVYRCLAGWEEDDEEQEEVEAPPVHTPARVTHVPTAPAGAPSGQGVPMMMTSTETVVISTILVTPDGQLMQMPIDRNYGAPTPMKTGDTVPPIPVELLEAAHSAPIDLAEGEAMDDVERTVVAFPPPPPTLPEHYESAPHTIDRAALEAAVVAAMDNLAQLEEEDMTLIMQRLPPQPKVMAPRTRSGETRLPEFIVKSKPPVAQREREQQREQDRAAAESKLRLRPAPRPPTPKAAAAPAAKQAAPGPRAGTPKVVSRGAAPPTRAAAIKPSPAPARASVPAKPPVRASVGAKPAAAPARASASARPAAAPVRAGAGAKPATAPARAGAGAKPPAKGAAPVARGSAAKPSAAPARAGGPSAAARPAAPPPGGKSAPSRPLAAEPASPPKATRPNNPLADRLRRRAGLSRPDAAPGSTDPRATEPIAVRRGNPPNKK